MSDQQTLDTQPDTLDDGTIGTTPADDTPVVPDPQAQEHVEQDQSTEATPNTNLSAFEQELLLKVEGLEKRLGDKDAYIGNLRAEKTDIEKQLEKAAAMEAEFKKLQTPTEMQPAEWVSAIEKYENEGNSHDVAVGLANFDKENRAKEVQMYQAEAARLAQEQQNLHSFANQRFKEATPLKDFINDSDINAVQKRVASGMVADSEVFYAMAFHDKYAGQFIKYVQQQEAMAQSKGNDARAASAMVSQPGGAFNAQVPQDGAEQETAYTVMPNGEIRGPSLDFSSVYKKNVFGSDKT